MCQGRPSRSWIVGERVSAIRVNVAPRYEGGLYSLIFAPPGVMVMETTTLLPFHVGARDQATRISRASVRNLGIVKNADDQLMHCLREYRLARGAHLREELHEI